MSAAGFGERLGEAMRRHGPLCAGIDPHPGLLRDWGLSDDVAGLRRFTLTAVEAFAGGVAAVKPQSAFFERHGSAGIAVLEEALAALRDAGTLSLLDVKRGDIGSTMSAYADAYCGNGSALAADAVTVSPYLGFESLRPLLDLAAANRRGVFVLALTSNPDGPQVQHARGPHGSVAAAMVAAAAAENSRELCENGTAASSLGSVGLVVGATVGAAVADLGLDLAAVRGPLLAPGVGAQGAGIQEVNRVFGTAARHVLVASSRDVLSAGPDPKSLAARARRLAAEMARGLRPD